VKRAPATLPHISDQYYGWWSRPGGGIYILEDFKSPSPRLRCLTQGWPEGSFLRPDLSYDGTKVLFAFCRYYSHVSGMEKVDKAKLPEDAFYQIYEMNLDGTGLRQLTHGRYDDFDARYLPDGGIVFLSTRKGTFVQCTKANTAATLARTLPDSYVRCGGDNKRPCAVYTLHVMDADGRNMRPISAFETFEYTPSVADDGRLLYTRWDYIDRFNGHFFSLWSANQDGTNPQLVYGNYTTKPQATLEARSVPGSGKILFTAAAHHSITGGSLALLDTSKGNEGLAPLTRLTPEVPFPETEAWDNNYYANPYPLSEDFSIPIRCRKTSFSWRGAHIGSRRTPAARRSQTSAIPSTRWDSTCSTASATSNCSIATRPSPACIRFPFARAKSRQPNPATSIGTGPRKARFWSRTDRRGAGRGQAPSHRRGASEDAAPHEPAEHRRLGRGPGQVRSGHGAGRNGRLGFLPRPFRRPFRHTCLLPGAGRARHGLADHAHAHLCHARPDSFVHRLSRIASAGAAARQNAPGDATRCLEADARARGLVAPAIRPAGAARSRQALR